MSNNPELFKKLEEYGKKFDDTFPMIPLAWGRSDEEIIKLIDECLEDGKDVYEKGLVKDGEIY